MDEFLFRIATESDFAAVAEIALKSFLLAYAGIFSRAEIEALVSESYAPPTLARFVEQAGRAETHFEVVTRSDERLVGFCVMGSGRTPAQRKFYHRFYSRMIGHLYRLYLDPAFTGKGVGHALMSRGEDFLRERGIFRYSCYVHRGNEIGKRFYLREGFRHVAEKDRGDDWYMEKSLLMRALVG